MLGRMKLILRIQNTIPLFMVLLILQTVWKLGWQHASHSKSPIVQSLAGAAAFQSP